MAKRGLVAGSFDPITNGHAWMFEQALTVVDELTIVIGVNPKKKYLFSIDERKELVKQVLIASLGALRALQIELVTLQDDLLVNFAAKNGITTMIRGIRNTTDFNYEQEILLINKKIQPAVETFFVVPPRHLTEVSSSTVKGLVGFTGWEDAVKDYIHPVVLEALQDKHKAEHTFRVPHLPPVSVVEWVKPIHYADTAQAILRQPTEQTKVVIDFHDVVPAGFEDAIVYAGPNWEDHNRAALIYEEIDSMSNIIVYVKGSSQDRDIVEMHVDANVDVILLPIWGVE